MCLGLMALLAGIVVLVVIAAFLIGAAARDHKLALPGVGIAWRPAGLEGRFGDPLHLGRLRHVVLALQPAPELFVGLVALHGSTPPVPSGGNAGRADWFG